MSITFNDIQQGRKILQRKYQERKALLQERARDLFVQYEASLELPSERWRDANGIERWYVATGEMDQSKQFLQRSIVSFNLSNDYELTFAIATVVDDSPISGGSHYVVHVSLWMDKGRLHVDIGKGKKEVIVANPDEPGAFYEVCSAIKELVMFGITDPRLD